jgi:signal transduction histidine kinase
VIVRASALDPLSAIDPLKDVGRLREIADLGLDSPEVDEILDDLVRQAAEKLDLPIGVVSVVMDEAQSFIADHGIDGWMSISKGTPAEWSFCRNVVTRQAEFIVEDALVDETMKDSPLVRDEGIRCYAGIPLVTSRGNVIGSFCVQGREERRFTAENLQFLRGLAEFAMERIESRRPIPDPSTDARPGALQELEAAANLQSRRLRTLHAIDRAILSAESVEDIATAALSRLRDLVDCERAAIGLIDWRTREIVAFAAEVEATEIDSTGKRFPLRALGDDLRTLQRGSSIAFHDLSSAETIPAMLVQFREQGIRSSLQIPLIREGALVGVLSLMARRRHALGVAEKAIAKEVAAQLAIAFAQQRLRDDAVIRTHELDQLVGELKAGEVQRAELLRRLVEAHEDERRVIASAVHDDAIQKMAVVVLRLDLLEMQHPDMAKAGLTELRISVQEAVDQLRRLMLELHPQTLDTEGLVTSLRLFLKEQAKQGDTPVYEMDSQLSREPPQEMRATLFRIAQEAVRNARRHADASTVTVSLEEVDDGFRLSVQDDGVGFDAGTTSESPPGHLGLTAMRERAELVGGWRRVTSQRDVGTLVQAWVPGPLVDGP